MNEDQDRLFPEETEAEQQQQVEAAEAQEPQEPEEPQEERVDWKARAIEAQTRLEMMRQQGQQQQQPQERQPSRVEQLQREVQEAESQIPPLDDKNPQSFWEREKAKEALDKKRNELYEARLEEQQQYLLSQQVGGVVQSFKQRHANRPEFQKIQPQFDQAVQQLQPHLRGNEMMLDMIRKNLEYDLMQNSRNQRKPPAQAPSGAYQPEQQARQQKPGQVKWRSAEDQRIGEYYMQRGIISGPEEYYDPKYNEVSESANDNGTAIYDVPAGKRGWRR